MLTHDESATLAGGFRWCELALWRTCSTWAPTTPVPAAAVCLDVLASHAAWRAEQWWARLPVLASVDRDDLVVPPPGWAALIAATEGSEGAGHADALHGATGRLAVVSRVLLARLAAGYAAAQVGAQGPAAGPLARTLGQVVADVAGDWQRASTVLAGLLTTLEAVDEAAGATSGVEGSALRHQAHEAAE